MRVKLHMMNSTSTPIVWFFVIYYLAIILRKTLMYWKDLRSLCLFMRKSTSFMFGQCKPCTHCMNIQWWPTLTELLFTSYIHSVVRGSLHVATLWHRWDESGSGEVIVIVAIICVITCVLDSGSWKLLWLTQTFPHHNCPHTTHAPTQTFWGPYDPYLFIT